jgi:carboxymethylenebutenolidase
MGQEITRAGREAYLAKPAEKTARGVLVLHEAFGLTPDICAIADRIASHGYVALAPAMFRRGCLMRTLRRNIRHGDFDDWRRYLREEHGVERDAVIGFCMGGGFAIAYAATSPNPPLAAIAPNYGFPPKAVTAMCPLVGSYGENDRFLVDRARQLDEQLDALGVDHDIKIYPGAGHSFMNRHEGGFATFVARVNPTPLGYDEAAAEDAWRRIFGFFEAHLGSQ